MIFRNTVRTMMVAAMLVAPVAIPAQPTTAPKQAAPAAAPKSNSALPKAFAQMPADVQTVVRVDFNRIMQTPQLARYWTQVKKADPKAQNQPLRSMAAAQAGALRALVQDFPGEVMIFEAGARMRNAIDPAQGKDDSCTLVYGRFDGAAISGRLKAAPWATQPTHGAIAPYTDPTSGASVAMLNNYTLAIAGQGVRMNAIMDTAASIHPSLASKMTGLAAGAEGAAFFVGGTLDDAARADLAAMAKTPPPQVAMVAGLPQAMQEAGNLTGFMLSVGEDSQVRAKASLHFANAESAGRASTALNQAVQQMLAIMQMQAASDPKAQEMLKEMAGTKFVVEGNTARLSMPIPAQMLDAAIAGMSAGSASAAAAAPAPRSANRPKP